MSVDATIRTPLVKTSEALNSDILDERGHKIGAIREIYFEPTTGQAHFAIVEAAALLGGGGKYHPVPWSVLRFDPARPAWIAPFDKDRLKAGPSYDRDQLNSPAYGWDTRVRGYYAG